MNEQALYATHQKEVAKWDALAGDVTDERLRLKPGDDFWKYAERTNTLVGINEFFGKLEGKRVLEVGCGLGQIAALMARSGAEVTAFDLSKNSVATSRRRSELNSLSNRIDFVVAAGEAFPFENDCFDILFGKAILHHVDVSFGSSDLYRVLKPGGKAAFVEPLGMNPLLNFVREYVPYPNKNPRGEDRPLSYEDIYAWGNGYRDFHFREIRLLSMIERGLGFGKQIPFLRRADEFLLKHFPILRRYCRYAVLYMVK
ncbi:MAG: methyltransferase domain-containing protein [Candidatus Promineifilaceae bacterium]|nr:methyltransferase domain-containing protein [Candidatus Promineifilaceae bacterium]